MKYRHSLCPNVNGRRGRGTDAPDSQAKYISSSSRNGRNSISQGDITTTDELNGESSAVDTSPATPYAPKSECSTFLQVRDHVL